MPWVGGWLDLGRDATFVTSCLLPVTYRYCACCSERLPVAGITSLVWMRLLMLVKWWRLISWQESVVSRWVD